MKYEQPQIVAVGTALASVQSGATPKPAVQTVDLSFQISNGAYEADE